MSTCFFGGPHTVWMSLGTQTVPLVGCPDVGEGDPAAPTSLNSWIWVCSNMENTLELPPSIRFLAFFGAWRGNVH